MADLPGEIRAFVAEKGDDGVDRGLRTIASGDLGEGDVVVRVDCSSVNYKDALATIPKGQVARISPLVPGELSATPRFSEQQQRLLRALCRPLMGDGEGTTPATDDVIAAETGIPARTVTTELDHLTRALALDEGPPEKRRRELALLALRSGLVEADDNG